MRIGIGLPAAMPGIDGAEVTQWAAAAAAAAATTERVELPTTVLNVPWRRNAVVLAKHLASVERLSGGQRRSGEPRIVAARYACLGPDADDIASHYLQHYYGPTYLEAVRADTATTGARLEHELDQLAGAGCHDVVLLPCCADLDQVARLADALDRAGRVAA